MGADELKLSSLPKLTYAMVLVVLLGSIFVVGKSTIVPIFIAAIAAYVLTSASRVVASLPVMRASPQWVSRVLVLLVFTIVIITFFRIIVVTAQSLAEKQLEYQDNFTSVIQKVLASFGHSTNFDGTRLYDMTFGAMDLRSFALSALSSISSAGGTLFLIIIYTVFLMGERAQFVSKIYAATTKEQAERVLGIINEINGKIADYLGAKTLVNIVLGVMSFAILFFLGVDFAVFWAILIALLNYIPYVGSALGVALPVLLSIAQFGSVQTSILTLVLLMVAQIWVGNFLEPRVLGKRLNMSPFVVLLSLSVFSSLWGLAGAILAVPLTSILAIVLGSFDGTRFLAVMLAENVQADPE